MHNYSSKNLTGITLRTTPFKERDRIITFFSPDGLHNIFVGSALGKKSALALLTTPLSYGELVISQGRGSLWRSHEGRLLSPLRGLRNSYDTLETATALVDTILRSQLEERPSPALFQLFLFLIKKLDEGFFSKGIPSLFKMKVLVHDGLFGPSDHFTEQEWILLSSIVGERSLNRVGELIELEEKIERFFREAVGHCRSPC